MEQQPIEQPKDELSERFLVAAFERAWGVMPFEWRKVADSINMDHKSAEVLAAKLETTGWLRRVGPEYLCLTEKIEPVYVASKATNPPIDLADTRERHFLAMAYERGGVFNFSMLARRAGFYEGEDAPGFHDFHRKLYSAGYAFGTSQSTLTQKGIYHAKRLAEEMNAKIRPNDDKFCARWKGHQSEAQKFLIWAWKQHKGDLHKPVDLRAYAFATGRGRYDAKAIEDWVVSNEYMICSATRTYANQHAFDFWHEPYNAHFPYGYFLDFTREGIVEATQLIEHEKQRFSRWVKTSADFIGGLKGAMAGLAVIISTLAYMKGRYDGMRAAPTSQPTSQPSSR